MSTPNLQEIRILPPLAIARLGASPSVMDNFDLLPPKDNRLGWRNVVPAITFRVDENSGEIREAFTPEKLRFKDESGLIRPVAPFLEVWARFTKKGPFKPLTLLELAKRGLKPSDLHWTVHVANHKVFRRTGQEADKVDCSVKNIAGHRRRELYGRCDNFVDGKTISFGWVQYIKPTKAFPEIRFLIPICLTLDRHRWLTGVNSIHCSASRRLRPECDPRKSAERRQNLGFTETGY